VGGGPSRPRPQLCAASIYLRIVLRDMPVDRVISRMPRPACHCRTTSVISTRETSLYAIVAPAQSFCDNGNSFIFPGGSKIPVKVGQCSRLKCFLVGHSSRFLTTVLQKLRNLRSYDGLLSLFETLGFTYANEPRSMVDWAESTRQDVSEYRLAAKHGAFNVFYIVIPSSHMFSRERQIT